MIWVGWRYLLYLYHGKIKGIFNIFLVLFFIYSFLNRNLKVSLLDLYNRFNNSSQTILLVDCNCITTFRYSNNISLISGDLIICHSCRTEFAEAMIYTNFSSLSFSINDSLINCNSSIFVCKSVPCLSN